MITGTQADKQVSDSLGYGGLVFKFLELGWRVGNSGSSGNYTCGVAVEAVGLMIEPQH